MPTQAAAPKAPRTQRRTAAVDRILRETKGMLAGLAAERSHLDGQFAMALAISKLARLAGGSRVDPQIKAILRRVATLLESREERLDCIEAKLRLIDPSDREIPWASAKRRLGLA
jgi:hypothetical protein